LGRSLGDTSLLGVVHIDGNGIGQKIKRWLEKRAEDGTNDAVVRREYQKIATDLEKLGRKILQTIVDRVIGAIVCDIRDPQHPEYKLWSNMLQKGFTLSRKGQKNKKDSLYLPLRPILLGGDDFTFVCDGRIALDLAAAALAQFGDTKIDHINAVQACAGVALVRTHTPFARAYDLAESLCMSAKRFLKDKGMDNESALDWHIGLSSPTETLSELRKRQYRVSTGELELTCCPYRLGRAPESGTWRWLAVLGPQGNGFQGMWRDHRSKLKTLREVARDNQEAVKKALEA
jgi:hypothetical protein